MPLSKLKTSSFPVSFAFLLCDSDEDSIKVDPTLKEAVWLQMQLYLLNGDDVSAMANVDTLLAMSPGCLQGKAAKARLLARAGDTDSALACLDACMVIEPNASFWHTEKAKLYLTTHVTFHEASHQ